MSVDLKWTCVAGALVITVWSAEHGQLMTVTPASSVFRPVVVAELFTSEGCSSCPPADDVLSQLARQPASDVEVLALGEHVDYWDRLGWRDPFSSPAYSSRQSNYDTRVFHRNEVYTPQLVIDGRFESVGSDVDGIHHAITQAAAAPKALVEVTIVSAHDRQLGVTVHVGVPPALTLRESVDVLVAVAEDNLLSRVRRGENGGRTLRHSGVVRSLASVGTLSPHDRAWSTSASVVLEPEWQRANIRVVSFLQEHESRRIVGAGSSRLGPAEPGFESNDTLSNVVKGPAQSDVARVRAFLIEERPMKWSMSSVAILVAVVSSAAVDAQSGGMMAKGGNMDKMEMMDAKYTGCLEASSAPGTFMLTHAAAADHMGKEMMKKDTVAKATMAKDGMSKDAMAPTTLTLTGSSVDLSKHLGHQVSLTGSLADEKMDAMEKATMDNSTLAFTVKSLKMVAATCS